MSWFKVDDGLHSHPKIVELQQLAGWEKAIALWTLGGSYCAQHLTDGVITKGVIKRLGFTPKVAGLLVVAGLWEVFGDSYRYHDWEERNPTRAQVETKREATTKRVSAWRAKRERNAVTKSLPSERGNADSNAAPDPTRPDPTRNPPKGPPGSGDPAFQALWDGTSPKGRNRSTRQQCFVEWQRLSAEDKSLAVERIGAWAREWTATGEDFAPGLHRWLKRRGFDALPEKSRQQTLAPRKVLA